MREIKYRGIQNHTNQWIYGNLVQNQRGKYIIPFEWVENDGHHLRIISDIPVFIKEETVGEFTGLKDKNGVEIYEGDIVKVILDTSFSTGTIPETIKETKEFIEAVEWEEDCAGYHPFVDMPCEDLEVIGNIYESKDLLQ